MSPERARGARAPRGRLALALATAAGILVADQVTKHLAAARLVDSPVHLLGPLWFRLEFNTGIAFSLGAGSAWPAVAAVVALVAVLAVLARSVRTTGAALGLGLVVGGALGNLADRLVGAHHGAVVDFVYTGFWPTFNLADASIVVGCGVLLVVFWRRERAGARPPGPRRSEEADEAAGAPLGGVSRPAGPAPGPTGGADRPEGADEADGAFGEVAR